MLPYVMGGATDGAAKEQARCLPAGVDRLQAVVFSTVLGEDDVADQGDAVYLKKKKDKGERDTAIACLLR
jgi:hypothetical protein